MGDPMWLSLGAPASRRLLVPKGRPRLAPGFNPGSARTALLLALLLAACSPQTDVQEIEFKVPVTVREVALGTVEDLIVATGTLRARETAMLRVETSGFLTLARAPSGRRWAEGDRVAAGQVLAEITGRDVALESGLAATRTRYETAQRVLKSRQQLHVEGLISEEELREAETRLAEGKLEWERSQLQEDRTQLVSPIAGVILNLVRDTDGMPTADGQRVERGFTIARIAPIDTLVADVDLVGSDLARVEPGLEARLRHYAWENERFPGRLQRLAPSIDPATRTLKAEVAVENADGRLRPGMFVEVTLVAERRVDVPVVPREAVTERGGSRVVFVLNGQRVSSREVVLGLGDDDVVEVRQGLAPQERVVVRGLETLTDGAQVRVSRG
jgi:RND family efflux transporter MFP subunit